MDWEEACLRLEAMKATGSMEYYLLEHRCMNFGDTSGDRACDWRISIRRAGEWFITNHETLDAAIGWVREFTCPTPAVAPDLAADAERALGAKEIAPGIFGRDQELAMNPELAAEKVPGYADQHDTANRL